MKTQRILKHLLTTHRQVTRAFPRSALNAIEKAIKASEATHAAKVGTEEWSKVCRQMETAFRQSNYVGGVVSGVQAVTQHLVRHFPADDRGNELPDRPVML